MYTQEIEARRRKEAEQAEAIRLAIKQCICKLCFDSGLRAIDRLKPPCNGGEIEDNLTPCVCAGGELMRDEFGRLLIDQCDCGQPATKLSPRCADCDAALIARWRSKQQRWKQ